jgi:hypothetical protein
MDGGTTCLSFNRLIRVAIIKLTSRLLASWTWVSCCMQSSGQVATPTNDRWLASQVLLSEWECDETDDRYGVLWQPTTKAYSYSTTRGAWCRAKQEWTTRDAQQQRHRSPLELDSSSAWIHLPHTAHPPVSGPPCVIGPFLKKNCVQARISSDHCMYIYAYIASLYLI